MTKTRETAAERRGREAAEARAAQEKWEREKPARLLRAMATATDLNVAAQVFYQGEVLHYAFRFDSFGDDVETGAVSELAEWQMQCIEQRLVELREAELKRVRLQQVRKDVLARLSEEEREALGL